VINVTNKYFKFADIVDVEIANGRLEVVIESGATYLEQLQARGSNGKVDCFIIDCTDCTLDDGSIASELFTSDFYRNLYELLSPGSGFSQ
jgi:spermidine synthase